MYESSTLWCPECGNESEIQRKIGKFRKQNHLKSSWCVKCQKTTHKVEARTFEALPRRYEEVLEFFGIPYQEDRPRIDIQINGETRLSYGGTAVCPKCRYGINPIWDSNCPRCGKELRK